MFREMRRKDRQISSEEALQIIRAQKLGVLSVNGDEGYPYGVPVNYGYFDGKLYIHSTSGESHKIDAIHRETKVCLTIIAEHSLRAEEYTTGYRSVIVFGKARLITDAAEKVEAMCRMMDGIAPELTEKAREHCRGKEHTYTMIEIIPEHITGKARK